MSYLSYLEYLGLIAEENNKETASKDRPKDGVEVGFFLFFLGCPEAIDLLG